MIVFVLGKRHIDTELTRGNIAAIMTIAIASLAFILIGHTGTTSCPGIIPEYDCRIENAREFINPNTASVSSLVRLPGIGISRAEAIVDHRTNIGLFNCPNDLCTIPGIGPVTVEKIAGSLTFGARKQ